MEKEELFNKPAQIYNVGMPLDHQSPHVVVKKGQKKVYYNSLGNVTALVCVNAAGQAMPHYIIFEENIL